MTTGHLHPLTKLTDQLVAFGVAQGFEVITGPELVEAKNNFDLLNISEDHPARESHDTFYTSNGQVLRTHTSALQVPVVKSKIAAHEKPPFRLLFPGRVYRNEATDATHNSNFFQLEGVVIAEDANMAQLLGLLEAMISFVVPSGAVNFRYRPSYFPFVEPGFEMDIRVGDGPWLELLGAGMIHPTVLKNMGINQTQYQGFAFGMGLERLLMILTGLQDVRWVFSGDYRYLGQS